MHKVDLVYKIGSTCEWENYNELRYSIRSAEEHFKDLRNIIIVGFKPFWVNEKVIHIPAIDPYRGNKDGNLINKMILACLDERTSDEFINISDDQYFLKDVYYDDFKINYIDNSHYNGINNDRKTRWLTRLERTRKVLESQSLAYNCYDAHIPYMLNKKLYPKTLFKYDYGCDLGYCGNTLYFNTILDKPQAINSSILTRLQAKCDYQEIVKLTTVSRFLNHTYKAINDDLKTFLKEKFNKASSFEL